MTHRLAAAILAFLLSLDPGLAIRYEGTRATLSWTQPPDVALTCLHRFYGAAYPSARCWPNLPAGRQSSVWSTLDSDPAFRAHKGDVFKLCFSQQTEAGLVCEFVATAAIGDVPIYRVRLPLVRSEAPRYETRLPAAIR